MATHSRILVWRILMDRVAWWATVHRVPQSRTQLKRFSKKTCTHPSTLTNHLMLPFQQEFSLSGCYKHRLLAHERQRFFLEPAGCSNSASSSSKLCSPLIRPHVWKLLSKPHIHHSTLQTRRDCTAVPAQSPHPPSPLVREAPLSFEKPLTPHSWFL